MPELRSGTYTVTFTLTGFATVKREGVELVGTATVAVDAEMRVGSVEEGVYAARRAGSGIVRN